MQASLYQFIPNEKKILEKLLNATKKYLIISEPVINYSQSRSKLISKIARLLNNPGDGIKEKRFNLESFKKTLTPFKKNIIKEFLSGIEYVVLLKK